MSTTTRQTLTCANRGALHSAAAISGRILWILLRLPVLTVLLALEPFISAVLTVVGILGIASALILKLSGDLPRFPFWGMIAMSVGTLLLLTAYYALISLFAKQTSRRMKFRVPRCTAARLPTIDSQWLSPVAIA